jgi:hypothetical protein
MLQCGLTASFNGVEKTEQVLGLSDLKNFDIIFGTCSNPKFQNTDVAPMTLNEVVISDDNGKINRYWKLAKHDFDKVYDEIRSEAATVKNGIWLMDRHIKWTKTASLKAKELVGMAKNVDAGLIYLIGKTEMSIYSLQNEQVNTIAYKNGRPFNNYYNYFIYNPITNRIISYDFSENYLNEFDFVSQKWTQSSFDYKEPDFAYHNTLISPLDGKLQTFGGYGHYLYKSKIMRFDSDSAKWQSQDISNAIFPRYLSAAGLDENNCWLIFGGYGSKSGRQEVSSEFFYDLYAYDFKTAGVTKLQQYKTPETPFVPCESLVKNPESNSFYTLVYNTNNYTTSLNLAEFSIDKPEYTLYSDSIPYAWSDMESWCMFFLYRNTSNLIAVTAHKDDISIYTLAYPALAQSDVIQTVKSAQHWLFLLLCALGILGILAAILLIYIKKTTKRGYKQIIKSILPENAKVVNLTHIAASRPLIC